MNSQVRLPLLNTGFWLLVGIVLVGGWVLARRQSAERRIAAGAAAAGRRLEIERLRTQIAAAAAKAATVPVKTPVPAAAPSVPEPTAAELQADARATLGAMFSEKAVRLIAPPAARLTATGTAPVDVLTPDSKGLFPPEFATLFGMSDFEFERLQLGMLSFQQRMHARLQANAFVERDPGGAVLIRVPPLPEGGQLRAELREFLAKTMGQQNLETYTVMRSPTPMQQAAGGLPGVEGFFNRFGTLGRTIVLTHRPGGYTAIPQSGESGPPRMDPATGTQRIWSEMPVVAPGGNNPGVVRNVSRDELLQFLAPFAPLVPADF